MPQAGRRLHCLSVLRTLLLAADTDRVVPNLDCRRSYIPPSRAGVVTERHGRAAKRAPAPGGAQCAASGRRRYSVGAGAARRRAIDGRRVVAGQPGGCRCALRQSISQMRLNLNARSANAGRRRAINGYRVVLNPELSVCMAETQARDVLAGRCTACHAWQRCLWKDEAPKVAGHDKFIFSLVLSAPRGFAHAPPEACENVLHKHVGSANCVCASFVAAGLSLGDAH